MRADRPAVVVTGLGVVTPLGADLPATWAGLLEGRSGIAPLTRFDAAAAGLYCSIAGECRDFTPTTERTGLPPRELRRFDRFVALGLAAALDATRDAGLEVTDSNRMHIGVLGGSGMGGLPLVEQHAATAAHSGVSRMSPMSAPGTLIASLAGQVAIITGAAGPSLSLSTACAAGAHAIAMAARLIQAGDLDAAIVVGAESGLCPIGLGSFAAARALSGRNDDPSTASRPFDAERDGFVLSEGAGALVLESVAYARARGARVYCELAGVGMSADAYHAVAPDPTGDGAARAMRAALADAGANYDDIDHINAHATSTPLGDVAETAAIKAVFNGHASNIAVSATKSQTGHLAGAAGAVEAVFAVLAVALGLVPATRNITAADPHCDLDYVADGVREQRVRAAISNSFGFGGANASLLFRELL